MGFEVTKKNVKDVSSFPSQSELKGKKKEAEKKRKAKVRETSLQVPGICLEQSLYRTLKSPF